MTASIKSTAAKIMVFNSLGFAGENKISRLLIDDFTLDQHVGDNGVDYSATNSLEKLTSATALKQVTRNVSALATGGIYEFETVIIGGSFLKINNSGGSNGTCFIEYSFEAADFNALGHGILLQALDVDFDFSVNISINDGLASTGFQLCTGTQFFQSYSAFSGDKTQFNCVTRLRLDFKVEQSQSISAQITHLDEHRKAPNPAILNLLGLGNVELSAFYQKRHA
ncbi:hypothetical protein [Crenothrix polyspora]|jgi:hypothetical protein|uniref:Uncharacterized protein n=1 Tax=Crenothrix polyspora TaxID=360316 RepID=A0A1R4H7X1_9GAMM|nr:hypothetical protein [Crenothrix polyspora]SJM92267.1 hypothetical protein CRENPOLYSF1_270028 [Crenothrix polyspora]